MAPTVGPGVVAQPTRVERPMAANITVDAGRVVPNMVLARLGGDGRVLLANNTGTVDLVGDVMGYWAS